MQMDPELAAMLPFIPPQDFADLDECRRLSDQVNPPFCLPDDDVVVLEELTTDDGGRVRVFSPGPSHSHSGLGPRPAVLHIHGGGFCVGQASFDDAENYEICARTGVIVVSPEYRLAPECPFPAAFEDCLSALRWVISTPRLAVDRRRIAVMGHSAGGGLAAGLALYARDHLETSLAAQFLLEPELDDRLATDSMQKGTDTPVWYLSNAILSWKHYLGGAQASAYAAPARAEQLRDLPRTYLTVNQVDPLRDEGLEYAARLLAAGNLVELHLWPGAFHGFTSIRHAGLTHRATDTLVQAVSSYLAAAN